MGRKWRNAGLLLVALFGLCPLARASGQEAAEARVNYASVHEDIAAFEAVINDVISSTFSSSPFAVVQKAKGVYIDGYGSIFEFVVNIHTAFINTPFGILRTHSDDFGPELKKRRIEDLKEKLIRVLLDNGGDFRQVRKEEWVTIVAYIEDRNFPDEPSGNKTIVLSALKKNLDELGRRGDRLKEFKQRMKIVEY